MDGCVERPDLLNPLDGGDEEIEYVYASRPPEEGVEDLHFHLYEPHAVRLGLRFTR